MLAIYSRPHHQRRGLPVLPRAITQFYNLHCPSTSLSDANWICCWCYTYIRYPCETNGMNYRMYALHKWCKINDQVMSDTASALQQLFDALSTKPADQRLIVCSHMHAICCAQINAGTWLIVISLLPCGELYRHCCYRYFFTSCCFRNIRCFQSFVVVVVVVHVRFDHILLVFFSHFVFLILILLCMYNACTAHGGSSMCKVCFAPSSCVLRIVGWLFHWVRRMEWAWMGYGGRCHRVNTLIQRNTKESVLMRLIGLSVDSGYNLLPTN